MQPCDDDVTGELCTVWKSGRGRSIGPSYNQMQKGLGANAIASCMRRACFARAATPPARRGHPCPAIPQSSARIGREMAALRRAEGGALGCLHANRNRAARPLLTRCARSDAAGARSTATSGDPTIIRAHRCRRGGATARRSCRGRPHPADGTTPARAVQARSAPQLPRARRPEAAWWRGRSRGRCR